MAPDTTEHETLIVHGKIFHSEFSPQAIAAAGTLDIGFIVPSPGIIAMDRVYYTNGSDMRVQLYAASFTNGTIFPRSACRNSVAAFSPPVDLYYGVTAGTLGNAVSELTLTAASNAGRIAISGEDNAYVLRPTSYVLRLTNNDSNTKNLGFALDYRMLDNREFPNWKG